MTKTLTALVAAATLATASAVVPTTAAARCVGCAVGGGELSRLRGTAARIQLQLVSHAGLRCCRQHGRLARASSRVLLLVSRLSSVATALTGPDERTYSSNSSCLGSVLPLPKHPWLGWYSLTWTIGPPAGLCHGRLQLRRSQFPLLGSRKTMYDPSRHRPS